MPKYAYACTACNHRFDVQQSFSDDALTVCPECGGRLRKVFGAVGVVFKGSGFYRTDSRSSDSASVGAGTASSGDSAAAKSDSAPAKADSASAPAASGTSSTAKAGASAAKSSSSGGGSSTAAAAS